MSSNVPGRVVGFLTRGIPVSHSLIAWARLTEVSSVESEWKDEVNEAVAELNGNGHTQRRMEEKMENDYRLRMKINDDMMNEPIDYSAPPV